MKAMSSAESKIWLSFGGFIRSFFLPGGGQVSAWKNALPVHVGNRRIPGGRKKGAMTIKANTFRIR
jgi:hypothetical protein